MTWFKVDDSLHAHKKAMRAGVEAMGLWVLAGSWAADQLSDGWVPSYVALRFTANADQLAERLVKAGLWQAGELDGEEGWWFHGWDERQPSRDEVESRRKADAERRQRWRDAKKDPVSRGASQDASRRDSDRASRRESHPESRVESALPDPTRPDHGSSTEEPSPDSLRSSGERKRGSRIPEDFWPSPEAIEWARQNTPNVGQRETEQFKDYWESATGQRATKLDWEKAWRVWMRKAQEDAERRQPRRLSQANGNARDAEILEFLGATGTDGGAKVLPLQRGRS